MIIPRSAYAPRHLARLSQLLSVVPAEQQGAPSMTLAELNGFLVGLATSPDPVALEAWLPYIWGAGYPLALRDISVAQALVNEAIDHYNVVTQQLHDTWTCELLFDHDERRTATQWEPWVLGFEVSLLLAPLGWQRLINSSDEDASSALSLVMTLHAIATGESSLTQSQIDVFDKSAPDLLPHAVEAFHLWRHKRDPFRARVTLTAPDAAAFTLVSDTLARDGSTAHGCLCGSGRQYVQCCGAH